MKLSETQNISVRESLDLSDPPYTYETADFLPRADPLEHPQAPRTLFRALGESLTFCTGEAHWSILGLREMFLGRRRNPVGLSELENMIPAKTKLNDAKICKFASRAFANVALASLALAFVALANVALANVASANLALANSALANVVVANPTLANSGVCTCSFSKFGFRTFSFSIFGFSKCMHA